MPQQTKTKSLLEAATNTVLGVALNQLVLYFAGVPLKSAIGITAVTIVLSTLRSYAVRRVFN